MQQQHCHLTTNMVKLLGYMPHLAVTVLLSYKLHASRSAAGETYMPRLLTSCVPNQVDNKCGRINLFRACMTYLYAYNGCSHVHTTGYTYIM